MEFGGLFFDGASGIGKSMRRALHMTVSHREPVMELLSQSTSPTSTCFLGFYGWGLGVSSSGRGSGLGRPRVYRLLYFCCVFS